MKLDSPAMSSAACRFSPPTPYFGWPVLRMRAQSHAPAIRAQVTELVRMWTWKTMEVYNRVMEGDTAAVRYKLTTVFNPSGELITTEIVDAVKVSEHKVVEFHQFVDTAAIERLVARAHAAK
jgi:ketosteroid isomerase-like protein